MVPVIIHDSVYFDITQQNLIFFQDFKEKSFLSDQHVIVSRLDDLYTMKILHHAWQKRENQVYEQMML